MKSYAKVKYLNNLVHCVFALGIAWLILGCAGAGPKPTASLESIISQESSAKQDVRHLNEKLLASIDNSPQKKDYVIGEGDLLQITIFEATELNTEVRVGARGIVTLQLVGAVKVSGLSTYEAEKHIEETYRKEYLENPHVAIFVKEQHGSKITIVGAVAKPGTYDYYARQRLMSVLAMAGGLSENAGRVVQVQRASDDPNHPTTFLVDLDDLANKGLGESNIHIQGGDVVFVPETGRVYVDGAVRKAGSYPITHAMTAQQAVVAAGGFACTADEANIKLVRFTGDGNKEIVELSIEGTQGNANQIEVKDRDIVFVETDKLEALMYGLRLNLGGLVGIGYTPPPPAHQ